MRLKTSLLVLFLALGSFGQELTPFVDARVTSVIDGDTLAIRIDGGKEVRLRLRGVNAPEREQRFGPEARERLVSKILNKDVRAEFSKVDNLGRVLARVIFEGEDIAEWQLTEGFGWVFTHYVNELTDEDRQIYEQALNKRKLAAKDFVRQGARLTWNFRVANKIDESRRHHRWCRSNSRPPNHRKSSNTQLLPAVMHWI